MKKPLALRAFALPLLTAGVMSMAPVARADVSVTPRKHSLSAVKSVAGSGATRHDWLQVRSSAGNAPEPVVRKASLGRGSWICSPAGFGKKSRCFRR
ncbi:hypothetical protein RXV86_01045 [Alisedimentitalea sp. MJ-SS2]|uniref:hypothetical protein n=1 Tax=Aliisedimentitalea sp. MJ-SS2 TaxID=3049795 RepID=UPI002909916E|nr:hypothetical protein [Alisedimentitalea sp. MJ-SS2]MDU8925960.1 hypothetical protein [Alisedimentitalea sp. MJ-SS2]